MFSLAALPSLLGALWRLFLAPLINPATWPGLALAVGLAYAVGWFKGDAHGDAQCNAAALQAEIARLKLEQKVNADAEAQEDADTAALLADVEKRRKDDAALIDQLKNSPDKCLLGPDAGRV